MSYYVYMPGTTQNKAQSKQPQNKEQGVKNNQPQPLRENYIPAEYYMPTPTYPSSHFSFHQMPPPSFYPQGYHHYPISSMPNLLYPQNFPPMDVLDENKNKAKEQKKQIQSAKKNSQSNLVNQFFSYFINKERSVKLIQLCICSLPHLIDVKQNVVDIFYEIMHMINVKRGRKYINRNIIITLFKPQTLKQAIPQIQQYLNKTNILSIEDICLIMRKICWYFFRRMTVPAVLSSRRICMIAKQYHLKKLRIILVVLKQIKK